MKDPQSITGFCLCFALVGYAYAGYPLLVMLFAMRRTRLPSTGASPVSASILLAARDEPTLPQRIADLRQLLNAAGIKGDVIVALDGPTEFIPAKGDGVRVIQLAERQGKAAALTIAAGLSQNEILIFADARQSWEPTTIPSLLKNFEDPTVGAASGELIVSDTGGVVGSVGAYWKYEKWIRKQESRLHSTVGVTGAISAVRRELFGPLPSGLILDDVYWPMRIAMAGRRVVFDETARAYDRLPDSKSDEFRRKVRTLGGNFQLLQLVPSAMLPWKNPICWQFISHKLLRLAVPWALLAMLALNVALAHLPFFRLMLGLQIAAYCTALLGFTQFGAKFRLPSAGGALILLNAAAFVAFCVWASGNLGGSWKTTAYAPTQTA